MGKCDKEYEVSAVEPGETARSACSEFPQCLYLLGDMVDPLL